MRYDTAWFGTYKHSESFRGGTVFITTSTLLSVSVEASNKLEETNDGTQST